MRTKQFYGYTFYKVADLDNIEEFNLRIGYNSYEFRLYRVKSYIDKDKFGLYEPELIMRLEPATVGETGLVLIKKIERELFLVELELNEDESDMKAFILEKRRDEEDDWTEISYIQASK